MRVLCSLLGLVVTSGCAGLCLDRGPAFPLGARDASPAVAPRDGAVHHALETRDLDGNGAPDHWWQRLPDGRVRHAIDRDHDGFADTALIYRDGVLIEQRFDLDRDGRLETRIPLPAAEPTPQ